MNKRVGLNALAMITVMVVYSVSAILFTIMCTSDTTLVPFPVTFGVLGWKFLIGLLILVVYIVVGYLNAVEPVLRKPFAISYWIFLAIFAYLFINITLLPSATNPAQIVSSFPLYSINYFGWYQGYFMTLNIDIAYGFNALGMIQLLGVINLVLGCTIWRIKL